MKPCAREETIFFIRAFGGGAVSERISRYLQNNQPVYGWLLPNKNITKHLVLNRDGAAIKHQYL